MIEVFVDTSFFVAHIDEADEWHVSATQAFERLRTPRLHTSQEVLTEFLAFATRRDVKPSVQTLSSTLMG